MEWYFPLHISYSIVGLKNIGPPWYLLDTKNPCNTRYLNRIFSKGMRQVRRVSVSEKNSTSKSMLGLSDNSLNTGIR